MSTPSITPEAAELGRRMFDSLRSTDMRYEGAHILAEYIVQAGQMFQAAAEVAKSNSQFVQALDEQREQIEELAALTPSMLARAEARLAESTDRQVAAIAAAGQAQRQVLETVTPQKFEDGTHCWRVHRAQRSAPRSAIPAPRSSAPALIIEKPA